MVLEVRDYKGEVHKLPKDRLLGVGEVELEGKMYACIYLFSGETKVVMSEPFYEVLDMLPVERHRRVTTYKSIDDFFLAGV